MKLLDILRIYNKYNKIFNYDENFIIKTKNLLFFLFFLIFHVKAQWKI